MQTVRICFTRQRIYVGRFSADAACEKELIRSSGLDTKRSEVTEISVWQCDSGPTAEHCTPTTVLAKWIYNQHGGYRLLIRCLALLLESCAIRADRVMFLAFPTH